MLSLMVTIFLPFCCCCSCCAPFNVLIPDGSVDGRFGTEINAIRKEFVTGCREYSKQPAARNCFQSIVLICLAF